jgi:hypothetical protein
MVGKNSEGASETPAAEVKKTQKKKDIFGASEPSAPEVVSQVVV